MSTKPITGDAFRMAHPEFLDPNKYPDFMVNLYLQYAFDACDEQRWSTAHDRGQMLLAAHFITLESQLTANAARGAPAGAVAGTVSSKSVGGASISYDVSSVMEQGAGHWNQTLYGRMFFRMMRLAGAGGVQVTGLPSTPLRVGVYRT